MNNVKIIIILLVVFFTTNRAFTQTTEQSLGERFGKILFNKQNSLTFQTGLLNYFYDENPQLMNLSELKNFSRLVVLTEVVLIKTRGLSYTRRLNDKSNINFIYTKFNGHYTNNTLESDNSKFPLVTSRRWFYFGVEYNRLLLRKSKFTIFYGGGLNYRKGFEYFKVLEFNAGGFGESISEGVRVQNIGATLNLSMRYSFWNRFFLYSKVDIQGYFCEAQVVRDDFQELNDKWETREFEPSSRINHTFTIGIGIDF